MTVSEQDRVAMLKLMQIMKGDTNVTLSEHQVPQVDTAVELAGAGQVTSRDIQAMADVLQKLNTVMESTHKGLWQESAHDPEVREALITEKQHHAVKIGQYKIHVTEDADRTAGKQHYSVVNVVSGDTLAHELSLYEAAHGLVRMLNKGLWINSPQVRSLLEAEATYTGHRIDAIRYHRMIQKAHKQPTVDNKLDLYETRKQTSLDKSMQAKRMVKKIYSEI